MYVGKYHNSIPYIYSSIQVINIFIIQLLTCFSRNGELLLSVTPHTRYELLSHCTDILTERSVIHFDSCTSELAPLFSELDIVGIVIEVNHATHSSNLQTVYIADAKFNLFGITFWDGLKVSYVLIVYYKFCLLTLRLCVQIFKLYCLSITGYLI